MQNLTLPCADVRKLLASANADAALLYLHLQMGTALDASVLGIAPDRLERASATLQQLGLLQADSPASAPSLRQPPVLTETDVIRRVETADSNFQKLRGEVQRRYGRVLSTEELKSLITMTDYLRLPTDVVGMLLSFCVERANRRGAQRMPTLRMVEQEAFRWVDLGVTTVEAAAAHMEGQLCRYGQVAAVARLMQVQDRKLTPGEERYILSWLDMGFGEAEIQLAAQRVPASVDRKWGYLHSILKNWDAAGLHTAEKIQAAEAKQAPSRDQRQEQFQRHGQPISPLGLQAIKKLLEEEDS